MSPDNDVEMHFFEFLLPSFSLVGSLTNNLLYIKQLFLKDKCRHLRIISTFHGHLLSTSNKPETIPWPASAVRRTWLY